MPPVTADYMVGYLMDAGLFEGVGMGRIQLSWTEIANWVASTNILLEPWEKRLIRKLSADYISATAKAEAPGEPAPYQGEDGGFTVRSALVDRQLGAMFDFAE